MSVEIKPSVGRIVHYYPPACGGEDCKTCGSAPYAAIIAALNKDGTLNLGTFGDHGNVYPKSYVEFSESPKPGYWSWPPRV